MSVRRPEPQFSRWTNYASILGHLELPQFDVPTLLASELGLYDDGEIALFYAPFDYVETTARLAIVGVTPGPTQAIAAIESARERPEARRRAARGPTGGKAPGEFQGNARRSHGVVRRSRPDRSARPGRGDELFSGGRAGVLHTTSSVRYPTFRRTVEGWRGWHGYGIGPLDHRTLEAMIERVLGPELRALQDAVIVPVGKANEAVEHLCRRGELDAFRCVFGFPHPSPASARRHEIFSDRRDDLARQVDRLDGRLASPLEPQPIAPTIDEARLWGDEIHIVLTGGNVRNNHFYLHPHLSFFPSDAVGPANSSDGLGRPLTVHFAGAPAIVETDIAGGNKLMLRCRREVGAFFRHHAVQAGDVIAVRRLSAREYDVRPVAA